MAHVTHVRRTSDDDDDVIARLRSNHFDPPGGGLTLPRLPLRVIWVGPDRQAPPPQVVSLQEALILFLRSSQPRRTPVLYFIHYLSHSYFLFFYCAEHFMHTHNCCRQRNECASCCRTLLMILYFAPHRQTSSLPRSAHRHAGGVWRLLSTGRRTAPKR